MHQELEHLVVADRYDQELRDLKKKKRTLLDILERAEKRSATTSELVQRLRAERTALAARQRELSREVESYEARRRSANQVLERGIGDADAAERQIAQVTEKLDDLETEQLEGMERDEQLASQLAQAEKDAAEAEAFEKAERATHDERMKKLADRWAEILPLRKATLAEMDSLTADRYEGLVSRKGRAIADVVAGSCSACQMVVRQQHIADLQRDLMHACGGCGRWLLPPG